MAKRIVLSCCLINLWLAASCGRYYSCDVAGYVINSSSRLGINGAQVRLYTDEPETADAEDHIVETSTMTSGGNSGYFSHKIIWSNWFGTFGDEGDTGEVWIGVVHEDYQSVITQRTGLLSGTLNVIADITMERASFEMPLLEGRITDSYNAGVNGVRVVLDLDSTADDGTDYVTVSGEDGGLDGVFSFTNIRWRDDDADSAGADTETAGIYIDDSSYTSTYTADNRLGVNLQSDDEMELDTNIIVTRVPTTVFSADIQGRCLYRIDTGSEYQEIPISGVDLTLTFTDDTGMHTMYTQTNLNGNYSFSIEWEEDPPNDNGTGLIIPEGEDVILVDIQYSSNAQAGNVYSFTDVVDYPVKTWINPNIITDRVDTAPGS